MLDLTQYREALLGRIEAGVPVLATGNSHELFGQAVIDPAGNRHQMLGYLKFETIRQSTRVSGDCLFKASFIEDKMIGFINRAGGSQQGDIERPFIVTPGTGAGFTTCAEGIRYKNLLGTYLTGPLLVRNPPLLKYFADIIAEKNQNDEFIKSDPFFEYQEKAYKTALSEL